MTTCVAAVCDDGNALVLVADKMIGVGYIESELEITKMMPLCKDWWVLFAGDDITPVFDIIHYAKTRLPKDGGACIADVQDAVKAAFAQKRMENAEALHLTPIGWDIVRFNNEGNQLLPNFSEIQLKINEYSMGIELLVAGFDSAKAFIFTLNGYGEERGIPRRSDIPGFDSIGSGSTVAMFMMYYRDLSTKTTVREAVYYALEAKYTGEQAGGVSESTDLFIARPGKELLPLKDEETIEEKLIPICYALSPSRMRKRDRETLNGLPELNGFPIIEEPKKKTKPKKKVKPYSPLPKPTQKSKRKVI